MNLFRILPGVAAASFALALSAHSQAYCRTYTCNAKTDKCMIDPQTGCNVDGKPLYWASSVVSFDVQQDGSPLRNISYDQLHEVVVKAFQRWTDARCDDTRGPSIELVDFGKVECAKPEYNKSQPNQNVITFHDSTWPYEDTGETLAMTTVHFNPTTGELYDANIEINSNQANFVLDATEADNDHDDLNAVLTHEIGHFLGLSHSFDPSATMFTNYMPGMTTLEADDIAAICASLPPGRMTTDPGTPPGVPRHGFSTECSKPESGCCASTIGGSSPTNGPLALWAFGLGLLAWCGRGRRSKRRAPRERDPRHSRTANVQ